MKSRTAFITYIVHSFSDVTLSESMLWDKHQGCFREGPSAMPSYTTDLRVIGRTCDVVVVAERGDMLVL